MDGETSEQIKRQRFPLASEIAVPPSNPMSELLDQVRYKKADLIAIDSMEAIAYMREHTGAIKKISDKPLRITENNMTVPAGEDRFRHMLDIATRQLLNDGVIEQILKKYNVSEDEALRVLPPYQKQQD